jgi:hypothetical protein
MDILHRLIQTPNSQQEQIVMSFLCSLSTNTIAFEVDNLYFRGNLDDKLLFQQSPSMDMAVVRLQNDILTFIPIGGAPVPFTITQAVVLNNNTSSSESSIELSPSIINSQCNPNLKY